ncbi:Lin1244/Lin1753 domain-containing protein [Lactiplantibacillus plantarum]|uniref:Lin1244/Lin1753 domain-containing protein n=1 Tax=Lactiplantibacillus plantarum TaxID=1590 RepID=UPI0020018B86|nr:Lin1244/Lin1753 domain-containing protein [Lactiplantibacillus plantarum]
MNNYFSHDSNARNSSKMLQVRMKYGAEGYGIYFMLLERLRDEDDYKSVKDYNAIAFDLRVDASIIKAVVEDFGLFVFTDDGKYFYSEGFNKRMAFKDEKSKRRSEAGKKGAQKRWANKDPRENDSNAMAKSSDQNSNTKAMPLHTDSKESKVNKSKSNKNKVNNYDDDAGVTREQVINDWTNLWGFPNGIARPEIDEWLEEFKPEVIAYAIWIAGEHQIGSNACLKYVRAIVAGWRKRKITTLDQAKKAAADHDKRTANESKPTRYAKPRRKEVTPKWMQNGASQAASKPNSSDNQQDDMSDEDFLALVNSQEEAK